MGENLADLGGMSLGVQALIARLEAKGDPALRKLHLELFFRSWANIWKQKASQAYLIQQLATDPHAPTPFRGNLVKNVDSFYEVFDVKSGDAMYLSPEARVRMW